jgi:KDO2-lipid IV(A) lauroyltransferase
VNYGNLDLALGKELPPEGRERLAREIYANIGLTFLEIARNFSLSREKMKAELHISPETRARLQKIIAAGKGAVFVSGHIANWELLGTGSTAHGYPVAIVVKKMNNVISQALIERQRKRASLEIIYSGGAIQKMKECLRRGLIIGFMVDQNVTGKKGIRANFFGVPAASIRGLAGLVKDTGVPVMSVCAFRRPDGTHELYLGPELPYLQDESLPEGSEERRLREEWLNTQQYQDAVEKIVRMHPDQWLWIHRRWKASRAPLDPATAHRENA